MVGQLYCLPLPDIQFDQHNILLLVLYCPNSSIPLSFPDEYMEK